MNMRIPGIGEVADENVEKIVSHANQVEKTTEHNASLNTERKVGQFVTGAIKRWGHLKGALTIAAIEGLGHIVEGVSVFGGMRVPALIGGVAVGAAASGLLNIRDRQEAAKEIAEYSASPTPAR